LSSSSLININNFHCCYQILRIIKTVPIFNYFSYPYIYFERECLDQSWKFYYQFFVFLIQLFLFAKCANKQQINMPVISHRFSVRSISLLLLTLLVLSCSDDDNDDPVITLKANAGPDQMVKPKEMVTLDGSASNGPAGFTYSWIIWMLMNSASKCIIVLVNKQFSISWVIIMNNIIIALVRYDITVPSNKFLLSDIITYAKTSFFHIH